MHNMLESNMDHIFNNRAISEEVRREFELYQPNNASERTFKNRPGNSRTRHSHPLTVFQYRIFSIISMP